MSESKPDIPFFLNLELALLHSDWKDREVELENLLAPEFGEIDAAGKWTERRQVIDWLLSKHPDQRWQLQQTRLIDLGSDSVIFIYHAKQIIPDTGSAGSLRSSVWRHRHDVDRWVLVFHQASKKLPTP